MSRDRSWLTDLRWRAAKLLLEPSTPPELAERLAQNVIDQAMAPAPPEGSRSGFRADLERRRFRRDRDAGAAP